MKRDMDLIRQILIEIEEASFSPAGVRLQIPGRSPTEISYHVKLLAEAGFIGARFSLGTQEHWTPLSLKWEGHEFLDNARNETVWNQTKELMVKPMPARNPTPTI